MIDTDREPSLADLAAASGLEPRLIRSWVAQGLLPGPHTRGPMARYPADSLERVLAILGMRDGLGMSLAAIRQELLVASPGQLRGYAAKGAGRAGSRADPLSAAPASSALDYLRGLRAQATGPAAMMETAPSQPPPSVPSGLEALEQRLSHPRSNPQRKARAEEWLRIPVTPDVELAVRGRLDAEQRTRLERCADLIRDILLGKDR